MEELGTIKGYMTALLNAYEQLRGKKAYNCCRPFWDLVIITTIDEDQKSAFELQIVEKRSRQELPLDLVIHVVSDPPGIRIGNGGSTLTALEFLDATYGAAMFEKKILLIHAGGWSQRMPSSTILGKAFSLLPHGSPPYQMLDFKLALYWPLVERIDPGVFLVCADDFMVYTMESDKTWRVPAQGFTALAHPSPISVGRTHGVFVIKNVDEFDKEVPVHVGECLQALQKFSDEGMKSHGALLKGSDHQFAGGVHVQGEAVYTDSSFYFGTDVMKKLLDFKKCVGGLGCEIDAYGDFLQSVGVKASDGYIKLISNVSQVTSNLQEMRQKVFHALNGSEFHVLILNASVFVHIGTAKELLYHFCHDQTFQDQMAFQKDVFNVWAGTIPSTTGIVADSNEDKTNVSETACVMHSIMHTQSVIGDNCVIDYCDFPLPLEISSNCILSNCQLSNADSAGGVNIPTESFLHTVPISLQGTVRFVTVYFNINDDLKKSVASCDVESLPFSGGSIKEFLSANSLSVEDVVPGCYKDRKISLWSLKLYPAKDSMSASFRDAVVALNLETREVNPVDEPLFSIADLLKVKDVKAMLTFRKNLYEKINSH
ncbi:fucose-1-phosphate guanylyltransferase-like [Physella acuta]|uniref:fucose-1-phosphate guanylyltransferase-like n=1 Tax=Physella acuta TaxID=109671 RepID=UPI0027DCD051|nr:fucose-1-phosphate guanylyltransferase-like [Physella acuta]